MTPQPGIRVPTPRQAATLRFVAAGILPAPSAEVAPLVRWGWLETLDSTPAIRRPDGYFPPLRLSADGWRAVAAALDAGRIKPFIASDMRGRPTS